MGTQASHKGPRDKPELLPSWALLPELPGTPQGGPAPDEGSAPDDAPAIPGKPASPPDASPPPAPAQPTPTPARWALAKKSLGAYARSGGGGGTGRRLLQRSARRYARASGGARKAANSATSGRAATAALCGFLSSVASRGVQGALEALGLGRFVGSDAETVLAAIENALAPAGSSREDAAARKAVGVVLEDIYERFGAGDGGLEALERMSPDDVRAALTTSIAEYIYARWLSDLGRRLEDRAVSPDAAVRLERDMRAYLRDAVVLDLKGKDPLAVPWDGEEGRALVEGLYEEAFRILGGGP